MSVEEMKNQLPALVKRIVGNSVLDQLLVIVVDQLDLASATIGRRHVGNHVLSQILRSGSDTCHFPIDKLEKKNNKSEGKDNNNETLTSPSGCHMTFPGQQSPWTRVQWVLSVNQSERRTKLVCFKPFSLCLCASQDWPAIAFSRASSTSGSNVHAGFSLPFAHKSLAVFCAASKVSSLFPDVQSAPRNQECDSSLESRQCFACNAA